MATQRTRETLRFRYGRCLNDECENCKSKKIIEVPIRKDFICPDCGKELHECPPPKKKSNGLLIGIIIGALVLIAGGIGYISMNGDNAEIPKQEMVTTEPEAEKGVATTEPTGATAGEVTEPISNPVPDAEPEKKPQETPSSRNKDLGYATWKGALKNGLPNDENGTMTYKENHRIDSRDPQARVAEPGDYIIGEYADGKLVQGIWYDKNNTVKGSIIIGR